MFPHDSNLSSDELAELEEFLASPPHAETSLDLFALDGFFTAILLVPQMIKPSQWLDRVWDCQEGKVQPEFASLEEAQRKINLLMTFHNMVASHLATDPEVYEPRVALAGGEEAGAWRLGFLVGMDLDGDSWAELAMAKPEWLESILSVGAPVDRAERGEDERRRWTREAGSSVAAIHDFWLSRRRQRPAGTTRSDFSFGREAASPSSWPVYPSAGQPRHAVKVGRNELCPCGSGRKHKRCCGANQA